MVPSELPKLPSCDILRHDHSRVSGTEASILGNLALRHTMRAEITLGLRGGKRSSYPAKYAAEKDGGGERGLSHGLNGYEPSSLATCLEWVAGKPERIVGETYGRSPLPPQLAPGGQSRHSSPCRNRN